MNPGETHGHFSWCELQTTDVKEAKKFYKKLLGWTLEDCPVEGDLTYTVIKMGDRAIGGICHIPDEQADTSVPFWKTYVTVKNVNATAKKVETLGGTILVQPTDIPGSGRFCVFRDPQGAVLHVITYE
jgi:uncharacterized protein